MFKNSLNKYWNYGKLEKSLLEMYQNNTVLDWLLLSFITKRSTFFLIKKKCIYSCRGSDPPSPLADCPAKNGLFFVTCKLPEGH